MGQDTGPEAPNDTDTSNTEPIHRFERKIVTWGLFAVAVLCVLGAILHSIWPDRIDTTTAGFVALAAAAVIFPYVKKLKIFDVQFEVRDEVEKQLKPVNRRVELIEDKAGLPGRPPDADRGREPTTGEAASIPEGNGGTKAGARTDVESLLSGDDDDQWEYDPNHGRFGGLAERDGWRLCAKIRPAGSKKSPACHIQLRVEAVSGEVKQPPDGKVTIFLHPTFGRWRRYKLKIQSLCAQDEITSWGAFTIGALVGGIKLELDLAKVKGGTPRFYEQ